MILPNSSPSVSSKTAVQYITQRTATLPVRIYPIGAISKNAEGAALTEMYDMHASGALAFSDGTQSVQKMCIRDRLGRNIYLKQPILFL